MELESETNFRSSSTLSFSPLGRSSQVGGHGCGKDNTWRTLADQTIPYWFVSWREHECSGFWSSLQAPPLMRQREGSEKRRSRSSILDEMPLQQGGPGRTT